MFSSDIFVRIIIAVVTVALLFVLIPPVLNVLGLAMSGDVQTILKVCIGAIALFYILRGSSPFTS